MRTSVLLASACAALAVATPLEKRDEVTVTDTDIVYTTKIVTITLGQAPVNAAAATTSRKHRNRKTRTRTVVTVPTSDAVPAASVSSVPAPADPSTVEAAAPSSAAPLPVSEPPAPVTSAAPAPAPEPSSSSAAAPAPAPAPPSSVVAPPPASTAGASSPTASTYQQAAVDRHNVHRANHGAGPVTWNQDLADAALIDAKLCTFKHWPAHAGMSYGQNLALGAKPQDIGSIITTQWYGEETAFSSLGDYGQAQPAYSSNGGNGMDLFSQWGHFTQVVWKGSTQIGCATWTCDAVKNEDGQAMPGYAPYVTYCFYSSPGNYANQYAANVGRPASTAQVPVNQDIDPSAVASSYSSVTGQKY